jgi:hypothetical protein
VAMKRIGPCMTLVAVLVTAGPVWGREGGAKGHAVARAPRRKAPPPPPPVVAAEPVAAEETAAEAPPPPPPAAEAPPPAPEPKREEKPRAPAGAGVEALRAQYEALKDELFRSRARRETLEGALLSTQLLPLIRWDGGRHHTVTRAEVRLDGVRLWESTDGLVSDKPVDLAPKSAPPGPHVLGVRVEVRSRDDAKLGYVSDQSFTVVLPEGKKTRVEITVDESGSAPSYNPEIEIEVASK